MIITGAQEPSRIPTSPQLLNPIDLLVQAVSVRDRIQVKDGEGLGKSLSTYGVLEHCLLLFEAERNNDFLEIFLPSQTARINLSHCQFTQQHL